MKIIKKALLGVGILGLSTLAMAKSYDVVFDQAASAGAIQLEPGQYGLKVDGANAIFKDSRSGREFTVPVKVENGDKKFDATAVESVKQGSSEKILSIKLGGSRTTLDFGQ
jgi:hypothetical protein